MEYSGGGGGVEVGVEEGEGRGGRGGGGRRVCVGGEGLGGVGWDEDGGDWCREGGLGGARTVGEMTAFCIEERRDTILTYVIDLLPPCEPRPLPLCRVDRRRPSRQIGLLRAEPDRPLEQPSRPSDGFLRGAALAFRGACPPGAAQDRPHLPVPGAAGAGAARGSHLQHRRIQHIRQPVAPQPDSGGLFVPGRPRR